MPAKRIKRSFSWMKKWLFRLLLCSFLFSILWTLLYKYLPVYYTPLMLIRYHQHADISHIEHRWIPLENISKHLQLAVISAEDQHFFNHHGFDFSAILAAFKYNKHNKKIRGASTITQQTAKNAFLWPNRHWTRKLVESWFTVLIEILWSKERILEVYLNSIEMGQGVFGADAAAKYWFNSNAIRLTKHQSSAIAAILPNPNKYKANKLTPRLRKKQIWIEKHMKNLSLTY